MLPCPYLGRYSSENGHNILHKTWIIALEKLFETFVMVSITDSPTIKYWQNLEKNMVSAKVKVLEQCRIGDAWFTPLASSGGNLFMRQLFFKSMYTKKVIIFCQ